MSGIIKRISLWMASILILLLGLPTLGHATTPADVPEKDELATDPVDVGLVNEEIEEILPDIIDESPSFGIGDCSVSASGLRKSGLFVAGTGGVSCLEEQRAASVVVCIQRRTVDRWVPLVESCRGGAAPGSSASATASTVCTPGTWKYRLYIVGGAIGSTISIVGDKSSATYIGCPLVFGEENP